MNDIIAKTLELDPSETDEHVYKLVQVCDMKTDIMNPRDSYREAACIAIKYPLEFRHTDQ